MKLNNLTSGNITRQLVGFSFPLFLANLLQSVYEMIDMFFVGQFTSSAALAAISSSAMICFVLNAVCMGVTMGGSVVAVQFKGAGDEDGQKRAIGTLFSFSALAAAALTMISLCLYRPILYMMRVPPEAMRYACEYMSIMSIGVFFVFGYNAVCAIVRGLGDAKSPLLFVASASVINIILDALLVGGFKLATQGAASATVIAQGSAFIIAVIYLRKRDFVFDFKPGHFRISSEMLIPILKIGLPSALQLAVVNFSYLMVTSMLNVYGVAIAAAAGLGLKINTFLAMPCWAIGTGVTTMVGQNMGAQKPDRARKILKYGLQLNLIIVMLETLFIQCTAPYVVGIFNTDPEVLSEGVLYLRICASINGLFYTVMYTCNAFATGTGHATFAMANSLLDSVVMRLGVSAFLGFSLSLGFVGIYMGEALSPLISAVLGIVYCKKSKWQ